MADEKEFIILDDEASDSIVNTSENTEDGHIQKKAKLQSGSANVNNSRKVPTIAEELAMNRQGKPSSLSPILVPSGSSRDEINSESSTQSTARNEDVIKAKQLPISSLISGSQKSEKDFPQPSMSVYKHGPKSEPSLAVTGSTTKFKIKSLIKNKSPANIRRSISSTADKSTSSPISTPQRNNIENPSNEIAETPKSAKIRKINKTGSTIKKNDDGPKSTVKRDIGSSATPKLKSPKRFTQSAAKSVSILEAFEKKGGSSNIKPSIVLDIKLKLNDKKCKTAEDKQVEFNFQNLVEEKYHVDKTGSIPKKNLMNNLLQKGSRSESNLDDEFLNSSEEEDDFEDDEPSHIPVKPTVPIMGKKPHPSKGKSLIGKYDIEDPFIDDTELLWEEQRASTRDGFFVFFGLLVEKEEPQADQKPATARRGGVRQK